MYHAGSSSSSTHKILRGVKAWVSEHLVIIIFMMGGASISIEMMDYHMILQGYYKLLKICYLQMLLSCVNSLL